MEEGEDEEETEEGEEDEAEEEGDQEVEDEEDDEEDLGGSPGAKINVYLRIENGGGGESLIERS